MHNDIATPRRSTSLTPPTARDWSETATNYRDAAALLWDLLEVREALRHDAYAARYSARALEVWRESHPLSRAA